MSLADLGFARMSFRHAFQRCRALHMTRDVCISSNSASVLMRSGNSPNTKIFARQKEKRQLEKVGVF
jgi:hypothetical protein